MPGETLFLGLPFAAANAVLPDVIDEHLAPLVARLAAEEEDGAQSALAPAA